MTDEAVKFRAGEEWRGCPHRGMWLKKDWPGCEVCEVHPATPVTITVTEVDAENGTVTYSSVRK